MPHAQPLDVSVVVVSWNTRAVLRDCLRSIFSSAGHVSLEVIVVDNSSADGSADMVANEFPHVKLLRNAQNRGYAAANNQGIAVSGGRYVLVLNPDTIVHDGAIATSMRFADLHPTAAVVGCKTRGSKGNTQYNCFLFPSLLNLALGLSRLQWLFKRNRFFGRARLWWWDYDSPREVDGVAGCFMLVRRQAIDEVGPMSEEYFMYSEDIDWCWRFARAGWKTMYTPDAVITHLGRCSSSQVALEMRLFERRSMLMFLEKKSGTWARRVANAMFGAAAVARLPKAAIQRLAGSSLGRQQWDAVAAAIRFHLLGRMPPAKSSSLG